MPFAAITAAMIVGTGTIPPLLGPFRAVDMITELVGRAGAGPARTAGSQRDRVSTAGDVVAPPG